MKKKSSTSLKRMRPIYILIEDRIVHVTTRARTPTQAKRKYCEQNDIGGADALRVKAITLDQLRLQNAKENSSV